MGWKAAANVILIAVIIGATAVCISYRAYRQNLEDQMTQTAENLSRAAAAQVTAEAKRATLAFADYLRMNMSALNTRELVPFSRELDHIKTYLFLEQLRFGAELQVVMDIGTTEFMLPALTVQPLVENAVKWGIGKREDGGTVRLTTRMTPLGVEIVVSDDGIGFDTKKAPAEDGRSHLGIQLVRQRLRDACGAELELSSRVGEGTVARIVLPKGA